MKSTWRSRLPMCKKCWQADQLIEEEKTSRLKKANEKEWHRRKNDCRENLIASKDNKCPFYKLCRLYTQEKNMRPNGLRYWRWGGRGLCLGAEKTWSQKTVWKCRKLPSVQCTLCWAFLDCARRDCWNQTSSPTWWNFDARPNLWQSLNDSVLKHRITESQCVPNVELYLV